jgi:HAD superfamily hydrolase (TIGR01509 family)
MIIKENIKGIIFDMDGLMVDTEKLYLAALHEIAAGYNIKVIPEMAIIKMMGRSPLESMRIFKEEFLLAATVEELLNQRETLMEQKLRSGVTPMKGLFEIIDRFYGRLQLAVATSSNRCFLDIVVDSLGIRNKFAVLQASDGIGRGKPDPEIFMKTVTRLHLKPEDCIVLEDSVNGVRSGFNAGCYVIAVPQANTRNQDFSPAKYIAGDLIEAQAHILALIGEERIIH